MGLQPIHKRHASIELDVLLNQDCCCCCCQCPGERSLSVISSLFNMRRWRRAALKWWSPKWRHRRRPASFLSRCPLSWSCRALFASLTWLSLSLSYTHSLSLLQIKEAADIIQKLHLIAQELPFDRWVRHPGGSFRQEHCQTRERWCISDVDYSSQCNPTAGYIEYYSILIQYHNMFLEIKRTFTS